MLNISTPVVKSSILKYGQGLKLHYQGSFKIKSGMIFVQLPFENQDMIQFILCEPSGTGYVKIYRLAGDFSLQNRII